MVIGSMVNGFFHLLINGVYWSYTSRILTFYGRYPVILGERFGATDDAFSYSMRSYLEPQNPQNNSIGGVPGISLFYFEGDVFWDPSIIFVKRIFLRPVS